MWRRFKHGGVRVSFGFCLLVAWFVLVNGWRVTMTVLLSAALHELGHFIVLRLCGAKITGFRIGILGAVLEAETGRISYGCELLAVLAGPGMNLAAAMLGSALGAGELFLGANLVLCIFNLLPVGPMDGGRALRLALCWILGPYRGEAAAGVVGSVSALAAAAGLGWMMYQSGGNLWLLPPAVGMLLAAMRIFRGKDEKIGDFL